VPLLNGSFLILPGSFTMSEIDARLVKTREAT